MIVSRDYSNEMRLCGMNCLREQSEFARSRTRIRNSKRRCGSNVPLDVLSLSLLLFRGYATDVYRDLVLLFHIFIDHCSCAASRRPLANDCLSLRRMDRNDDYLTHCDEQWRNLCGCSQVKRFEAPTMTSGASLVNFSHAFKMATARQYVFA